MDLNNAVEKHAEWKIKLRSAITKQEQLDAATFENTTLRAWYLAAWKS